MSETSLKRSVEFLKAAGQFKLGDLVTEASHPVTANLSEVARDDIVAALDLLYQVDGDVLRKFAEFVESGRAGEIAGRVLRALRDGGRIFFTGCGATGRLSILLDSIWRGFWRQNFGGDEDWENRTLSVMAGGDYALIKSVEGFEDFAAFGEKQMADLGVNAKDVVFAITEGGETSFVIGTAWKGVEAGAKVCFVYNNPDDVLCKNVERSREVIEDARIEKINLTTGPMAVTGSTRMQATSVQLCVMLAVLEIVVRALLKSGKRVSGELKSENRETGKAETSDECVATGDVPRRFLAALTELHETLRSPEVLSQLAKLVALEESVYRVGGRVNYFADELGLDVLTDTTERSPTFCTPAFRKFNDATASESWAFLFVPVIETNKAWTRLLKRGPRCVEWNESEIRALVQPEQFERTGATMRKISASELMRFRIGMDGLQQRPLKAGDGAVGILRETEKMSLFGPAGFYRTQMEAAQAAGAKTGFIFFGSREATDEAAAFPKRRNPDCVTVTVPVPRNDFLLNGVMRVGAKLLLNALSTCTMVRLSRVMGNFMIWVVPGNLKLIDRATRYVSKLTGLNYEAANQLLFEVIEYVEPRMKSDQVYPPVVGMAVLRHQRGIGNEEAENLLARGQPGL